MISNALETWAQQRYQAWPESVVEVLSERASELHFSDHDLLRSISDPLPAECVVYRADNPSERKVRDKQTLRLGADEFWSTSLVPGLPLEHCLGERLFEIHLPAGWLAIPIWVCGFDYADEMELIIAPGEWSVSKIEKNRYRLTLASN